MFTFSESFIAVVFNKKKKKMHNDAVSVCISMSLHQFLLLGCYSKKFWHFPLATLRWDIHEVDGAEARKNFWIATERKWALSFFFFHSFSFFSLFSFSSIFILLVVSHGTIVFCLVQHCTCICTYVLLHLQTKVRI